jgi:hypothetical protein
VNEEDLSFLVSVLLVGVPLLVNEEDLAFLVSVRLFVVVWVQSSYAHARDRRQFWFRVDRLGFPWPIPRVTYSLHQYLGCSGVASVKEIGQLRFSLIHLFKETI